MDLLLDMKIMLLKELRIQVLPFLLIPHKNSAVSAQQSRAYSGSCLSASLTFNAFSEDEGGDQMCLMAQAS